MGKTIIMLGNAVVNTSDIVNIEEKKVTFNITKTKPNPQPKPTKGFFKKLFYSDTIEYTVQETYTCLILKVKAGVQKVVHSKPKDDETDIFINGSYSSSTTNQLYDFYTIYNDKNFYNRVVEHGNREILCEIGNYPTLNGLYYPDYPNTNMTFDESIKTKEDFFNMYM